MGQFILFLLGLFAHIWQQLTTLESLPGAGL